MRFVIVNDYYLREKSNIKSQNINHSEFSLTPNLYCKWPPCFPNDPLNESFLVFILYKGVNQLHFKR